MDTPASVIKCVPIERSAYEVYGDLIAADESEVFSSANMGTAKRFNQLERCHQSPTEPSQAQSVRL